MENIILKCDLNDIQQSKLGNSVIVSFAVKDNFFNVNRLIQNYNDKLLKVEISKWREKRSLDANAYFHLLVNKIARVLDISDTECKKSINLDYGSPAIDKNGERIIVKVPSSVDIDDIYPYAKWIKNKIENGFETSYYLLYKQTHTLDSKEMSKLIDGAVYIAKQNGIETRTPEEIAKMKSLWESER